jgi:Rrf2 family protein
MQLTREADYAVLCVLEVSRNGRMSAAEVARRQNISSAFLGKIVGSLARAGILTTRRGVGGGIALARTPDALTLLEVVEAVQGPLAINQCLTHPESCDRVSNCYVAPIWHKAQDDLRAALSVSIADVIANGDAKEVATP